MILKLEMCYFSFFPCKDFAGLPCIYNTLHHSSKGKNKKSGLSSLTVHILNYLFLPSPLGQPSHGVSEVKRLLKMPPKNLQMQQEKQQQYDEPPEQSKKGLYGEPLRMTAILQ